jgi:hypothetical protein
VANELYERLLDVWTEKSPSEGAFRQTAIGARMARAKRVRIGGGKETGVPIDVFYAKSTETRVVNLIHQIDVTLGRHRAAGGFKYPEQPAPRRTAGIRAPTAAQAEPASHAGTAAVGARGTDELVPFVEAPAPAGRGRGGRGRARTRREEAPATAWRNEPAADPPVYAEGDPDAAPAASPEDEPAEDAPGAHAEAEPDAAPAASPEDDPDDDPSAASASAGAG